MKTVLAEPLTISKETLQAFEKALGQGENEFFSYDTKPASEEEWEKRMEGAEQVIIANTKLPEEAVRKAKALKYINVAFTGVDHVPMDVCKELGIEVSNAAGYSDEGVAEEVIGLAIALLRHMKAADQGIRQGGRAAEFLGAEIAGRTVGIIGTGKIGTRVAQLFKAMGANLIGYNRSEHQEVIQLGLEYKSLEEVMKESDIITVHLPQNDHTRDFLTKKEFDLMKPTAILINCARGPIVNSKDLAEALKAGKLAGAGVDVFNQEPPLSEEPLLEAPNTILMPHVAYFTQEAMEKRAKIVLENAVDYLEGRPVKTRMI